MTVKTCPRLRSWKHSSCHFFRSYWRSLLCHGPTKPYSEKCSGQLHIQFWGNGGSKSIQHNPGGTCCDSSPPPKDVPVWGLFSHPGWDRFQKKPIRQLLHWSLPSAPLLSWQHVRPSWKRRWRFHLILHYLYHQPLSPPAQGGNTGTGQSHGANGAAREREDKAIRCLPVWALSAAPLAHHQRFAEVVMQQPPAFRYHGLSRP